MARIAELDAADRSSLAAFETIIDVRSPGEFALDHLPGAVNLPVLSDAERAQVGTIYVQESRLRANRIGAAYVARNIARHLETTLADKPADFTPLVYCWRGGQRSNSMATILSRVGWRTTVLVGGYRTYRGEVQSRLYERPCELKLVLLDGDTGSAKTEILNGLSHRGLQIIDLEGLAEHRGSLFGGRPGLTQPSQKMFESRLLQVIERLQPERPVLLEAESSRIGNLMVPPALWQAMQAAPRIELFAPRAERARYLVANYRDIIADPAALEAALHSLPVFPAERRLEAWRRLVADGEFEALAEAVIELHYDPAYNRGRRKLDRAPLVEVKLADLGRQAQSQAEEAVARAVNSIFD